MYAKYEIPVETKHIKNSSVISHVSSEIDPEAFDFYSELTILYEGESNENLKFVIKN